MASEHKADPLQIQSVSKQFRDPRGNPVLALDNVTLDVASGEFLVLLGPSGCGKTTLLRCIAGFEKIDDGSINLNGKKIDLDPPHKRPVNTVFQSYALFPHMTIFENIAFGLENEKISKNEINIRVNENLDLVKLTELADRKPSQMSGGQQQRAALARALAKRPKVLLLDEPLAALDLKLRKLMQVELKRIHQATGTTFIFVTHDQNEAMALGDRIAVFNQGSIQQIGTPFDIYQNPKNEFVANFIGETNILQGHVEKNLFQGCGLQIDSSQLNNLSQGEVKLVIRPENFSLKTGDFNCGRVKISELLYAGDSLEIIALTSSNHTVKIKCESSMLNSLSVNENIELFVNSSSIGQIA